MTINIEELQNKVVFVILDTINISRGIPKDSSEARIASERELANFINSLPYFSEKLKRLLLDNSNKAICLSVKEDWYREFVAYVVLWSSSCEWLGERLFNLEESCSDNSLNFKMLDIPLFYLE